MRVKEMAERLNMNILTGDAGLDNEITGMYVCDLLSWVMSHSDKGNAWVTVHTHMNIAAVALLAELSCIIVPEHIEVEEATIQRARQESIPIISTGMNSYEICWKVHEILRNEERRIKNENEECRMNNNE